MISFVNPNKTPFFAPSKVGKAAEMTPKQVGKVAEIKELLLRLSAYAGGNLKKGKILFYFDEIF